MGEPTNAKFIHKISLPLHLFGINDLDLSSYIVNRLRFRQIQAQRDNLDGLESVPRPVLYDLVKNDLVGHR